MKQKRHSQPIIDSSLHVSRPHRSSLFLIRFTQYSCLISLLPSALHGNHAPCTAIMRPAQQSCALRGNHALCTAIMRPTRQSCALHGNHAPSHTLHSNHAPCAIPSGIAPKPPTIPAADSLRDCPTPPLADSHRDCPSHTWPLADSHRDCPNHHMTADSLRDCSSHL